MTFDYLVGARRCMSFGIAIMMLSSSLLMFSTFVAAEQGTEDYFGYYYVDNKMPYPQVDFNWVEINNTGTDIGIDGDDVSAGAFPINFNFQFYGVDYSQIYLNSNGQMLFLGDSTNYSNTPIPTSGSPEGYIAPYWDDLACYAAYNSSIFYQTIGVAPYRQFVVEWHNVTPAGSSSPQMTFEVILNETGDIWLQYQDLGGMNGSSATVGIENASGTGGCQYSYDDPALSDNLAIRISANPIANLLPASITDFGLEIDSDSQYEELIVQVGVYANASGYYNVSALISDGANNPIDDVENYSLLTMGTNQVDLHFNGITLYDYGWNGTYGVNISLWDSSGNQIDSVSYTTASYTFDQFSAPPIANVTPGGMNITAETGKSTTANFTIGNGGLGDLIYTIENARIGDLLNETFATYPTNWTITDVFATGWNWVGERMQNYFSYGYPCAGYLDTPIIDCRGSNDIELSFWHDWQASWSTSPQDGYVRGSIDGGTTWPYLIAEFHHLSPATDSGIKNYSISWADGQDQTRIRFDIYQNNDWWWYVDDVVVKGRGGLPVDWLNISPIGGTIDPMNSTMINLTVNATDLSPGMYYANIFVHTNDPISPTMIIPVNLTVLQAQHDIDALSMDSPNTCEMGKTIVINATVRNQGLSDETGISVDLIVNGTINCTVVIPSLLSGTQTNVSFNWTAPGIEGIVDIGVWAEPVTGEVLTGDNQLGDNITVIAMPELWVSPGVINLTVVIGDMEETNLTIGNSGFAELNWSIPHAPSLEDVAIFQDVNPWSSTSNQDIFADNNISYTILGRSDMGIVNLHQFDKVVVVASAAQSQQFYDDLYTNKAWFEEYADTGGILEIHAADWSQTIPAFPGNITMGGGTGDGVTIEALGHDILSSPNVITDSELDGWGSSYHDGILTYPASSEIILTQEIVGGDPVLIVSPWGAGAIIFSTQPLEYAYEYGYSTLLENILLYVPPFSAAALDWLSISNLSGTVGPSNYTEIQLTANASLLELGTYQANITLLSNDADEPITIITVNLTVLPATHDIRVLSADAPDTCYLWETIVINATVRNQGLSDETGISVDLIVNGTINCTVVIPSLLSGTQTNVSFNWTAPGIEGIVDIGVWAEPVTGENHTINNWLNLSARVAIPPSHFLPPHYDYGANIDADPRFDFLVINATVNITTPGYYSIVADLYDSMGGFITNATEGGTFTFAGVQFMLIYLDGNEINDFGADGPYNITIRLYDGTWQLLDNDTHTTAAHLASDFEPYPVLTLPWFEDFEWGSLGGSTGYNWTTSVPSRSGVGTQVSHSGIQSMYTRNGAVAVTSCRVNLSGQSEVLLTCWIRQGAAFSEDPDSSPSEDLAIEYLNETGSWILLNQLPASQPAGTVYVRSYLLPSDAMYSACQIRFRQLGGSGVDYDYWHLDDVCLAAPGSFAPPHNEYAVDDNGNGLYDWLVVEAEVNATIPGWYLVSGTLNSTLSDDNLTYLDVGMHTVELRFPGNTIYLWGDVGASYPVALEYYCGNSTLLDTDNFMTGTYSWNQFEPPNSTLYPPHSDYGLDTNGNGLYDWLIVEVKVNVTSSNWYRISGTLNSTLFDYNRTYLTVGIRTVELRFPSGGIVGMGENGPYEVAIVLMTDSSEVLDLDSHMTSVYTVSQFSSGPAIIGSPISDNGLDAGSNGLFDYLVVSVTVNVTTPGIFTLGGTLLDSGLGLISTDTNMTFLGAGSNTVELRFPCSDIYGSGDNGPYTVALELSNVTSVVDSAVYTTDPYLYTDFDPPDLTPPATIISLSGTPGMAGWYVSNVSVTLTPSDGGSGVDYTSYRIDGVGWFIYSSPFNITANGNHTVEFYSVDFATNSEPVNTMYVLVDKTAPQTVSHSYNYTLLLDPNDNLNGSGIEYVRYRVFDNSSFIWSAWMTYTGETVIGTGPGNFFIEFYSIDEAGNNESIGDLHNISLPLTDNAPPTTSASQSGTYGTNGWFKSSIGVTLNAVDSISGVNYTKYRIDGGNWMNYTGQIVISGEGTHTIEFYSKDHAGNTETTKSASVKKDTVAPTLTLDQANGTTYNTSAVTISWDTSDATSGIDHFEIVVDDGPPQMIDATELSKALNLSDGQHHIVIRAIDEAGIVTEKRVDIVVSLPPAPPGPEPPADILGQLTPWLLLVVVIVAACLILFFLMKRRKKDGEEVQPAPPMEQQAFGPQVPPQNPPQAPPQSPPEFKFE